MEPIFSVSDPYSRSSPISTLECARMDAQFQRNASLALHQAVSLVDTGEVISIADFGSGYGPSALVLAERGVRARLYCIDVNPALLELAKERALSVGLTASTLLAELDGPGVPAYQADIALASFVLTHCKSLEAAVSNLAANVRLGGIVVVVDVDYNASFVDNDEAALMTLRSLQRRLELKGLVERLDSVASSVGLRPVGGFACVDWIEVTQEKGAVKRDALGFVSNFLETDPAHAHWQRIGPDAQMFTRRLRRVFRRVR